MFGSNGNQSPRGDETRLQRGLAVVGGVVAAFTLSPLAFDASRQTVIAFTNHYYGYGWGEIATWAYFAILAATFFFAARVGLSDLIQIGRNRFGGRFF